MYRGSFSDIIFELLHPHFMAALSILLSSIYVFKFVCLRGVRYTGGKQIYILRTFLWFAFAMIWFNFGYMDVGSARATLRAMVAIIVLTEIAYNVLYIKDAIGEFWQWIFHLLNPQ